MKAGLQSIPERTFNFGVRIVRLFLALPRNSAGYAISNQLIRSGTSVGANIEEAQNSGSKKEFVRGMTIALKEARECHFWLRIISESVLLPKSDLSELIRENVEIIKILTSSVKKAKNKL